MNRHLTTAAAAVAGLGLCLGTAATAMASPATTHARVGRGDAAFLKSNEQVNLAEITLGKIILDRAKGPHARELARMTIRDHRKAEAAVKAIAKGDGVALPSTPSAAQQKLAAELKHNPLPIAVFYFKAQIQGHKTSIAQTKSELAHGSKPNVMKYARSYLPVAQMHLAMAKKDLHRITSA